MNDDQLLRYSRHILVDEIGIEAQQRFIDAHAIIVGAGGLGSPAAMYLAAAGVGKLTLVDADTVDLTNLQRQILHVSASVGRKKVESGRNAIAQINPEVVVNAVAEIENPFEIDVERLALWPVLSAGAPAAVAQTGLPGESALGGPVYGHTNAASGGPGTNIK